MADTLDKTLGDRTARYGEFKDHARITQDLKAVMQGEPGWQRLAADQRESLEIIAHKIARILNGDPNYADSWHDIAGYAKLVDDRLVRESAASAGKTDNDKGRGFAEPDWCLDTTCRNNKIAHVKNEYCPLPTLHLGDQHSILDDSSKHAGQACDSYHSRIMGGSCQNCGQDKLSHVGQRT